MLFRALKSNYRVYKGMEGLRFAAWTFPFRIPFVSCATSSTLYIKTHLTGESNFLEQLIVSEPCVWKSWTLITFEVACSKVLWKTHNTQISVLKNNASLELDPSSKRRARWIMGRGTIYCSVSQRANIYRDRSEREKPTPPTLAVNLRETARKFVLRHKQRENWFSKWVGHKSWREFLYLLLSPGRRSEEGDKRYELSKQLLISNNTTDWDIIEVNKLPL